MLVMIVSFSIYNLMEAHFISEYLLRNYLLVLMGHYWYQPFEGKYRFEGYFWQVRPARKGVDDEAGECGCPVISLRGDDCRDTG